ncbi:lipoprotein [Pseudonocardia sp. Ae406_Ps2]|nr:lipoprotein [Pseudonocardia sp. Ae406_Ps2]OLM07724.1 lipoprotein [Pseudonocardia sp. Ae331_Ps2]OLM22057.1 lipoprotein [Pseudonocardia sp. Ae706_Ps2]
MTAVVAGLLLAGCGGVAAGPEQQQTVNEPVDGPVTRLEVDSDAGDVRLVAGERPAVEQDLRWTGDARPQVEQKVEGGVLRITARCPDQVGDRCQARLVVTAPAASSALVDLRAGGIEVRGLTGALDLTSSAGGVDATGVGPGDVRAKSSAGSVELTFAAAAADVTAESSAGGVEVRVPVGPAYEVTAETSAGSTEVGVPDQPGADHRITAKSSAGGVSVLPAG